MKSCKGCEKRREGCRDGCAVWEAQQERTRKIRESQKTERIMGSYARETGVKLRKRYGEPLNR